MFKDSYHCQLSELVNFIDTIEKYVYNSSRNNNSGKTILVNESHWFLEFVGAEYIYLTFYCNLYRILQSL